MPVSGNFRRSRRLADGPRVHIAGETDGIGTDSPGGGFIYFISGAKVRNPAAAQALIGRL
jgi:hypothetical protein